MATPELELATSPEETRDRILAARPTIPCGEIDITHLLSEVEKARITEPGYALERLPLWLAEIGSIYEDIGDIPIVTLDLASSLPLYAQLLRAHEFLRDRERANELVRELFHEDSFMELRRKGEHSHLRSIHSAAAKDKVGRELLETAVAECLYQITPDEAELSDEGKFRFRQRLLEKLASIHYVYAQDPAVKNIETGWKLRIDKKDKQTTYVERVKDLRVRSPQAFEASMGLITLRKQVREEQLKYDKRKREAEEGEELGQRPRYEGDRALEKQASHKVPPGEGMAFDYILWQAEQLADKIVGNKRYRPSRHISADNADRRQTALSSIANTPQPTKELYQYSHAVSSLEDPDQHLVFNMLDNIPLPSNSIALITCFDGWPGHFQKDEELHKDEDFGKVALNALLEMYDKLAYGGKIVIFPWRTHKESYAEMKADAKVLDAVVVEFSRIVQHAVHVATIHKDVISRWMTPSDRETLATMSPIINDAYDDFPALIITKPTESSMNSRQRADKRKKQINRLNTVLSQELARRQIHTLDLLLSQILEIRLRTGEIPGSDDSE